jgi:biotin operon repressor
MSAPLPITRDPTSKREKIRQLLSEGNHSAKDIARIAGTTEAYVWKEKSKLKTAGFLIRRDTAVISKTSQVNIYTNNRLLNLPELDKDGVSKLYKEFLLGKRPAEVIAEYGFHPELVESEYQRFLRLEEYDIEALQNKFFLHFKEALQNTSDFTTKSLLEKYRNNGKLTIAEFINLTKSLLDERYRLGKISAIRGLVNGDLPDGWDAVLCLNCNKPIRWCMKNANGLRIRISDNSTPMTHTGVGIRCPSS